eukprot:gene1224-1547_t
MFKQQKGYNELLEEEEEDNNNGETIEPFYLRSTENNSNRNNDDYDSPFHNNNSVNNNNSNNNRNNNTSTSYLNNSQPPIDIKYKGKSNNNRGFSINDGDYGYGNNEDDIHIKGRHHQRQHIKGSGYTSFADEVGGGIDEDDDDDIGGGNDKSTKKLTRWRRFNHWFRRLMYLWKHLLLHTFNNNRRNKLSYFLGFSACFLVVFIVSLCVSIISNTPVVFLSLAEVSAGEMDIIIKPGGWTLSTQANYTLISDLLASTPYDPSSGGPESYHSPRIVPVVYLYPASQCPGGNTDPKNNEWKYHATNGEPGCEPSCFERACPSNQVANKGLLYILDTDREKRMGLGRDWSLPKPNPGQVYVQSSLARKLGVQKGDTLYIQINPGDVFGAIWANAKTSSNVVYLTVLIQDVFSSGSGKFSSSEESAIIIDYGTFLGFSATQIDPRISPTSKSSITNSNLYEYAQSITINLPPSRLQTYIDSNQDTILKKLIDFSSKVLYKIGFNLLDSQLPIMEELYQNRYVSLFLGLILNVIIFILLFLSILLIYSLLMIDVETRTFEMGVMRMIGTTRSGIIQLLLFKAFSYSLPSWVFGLVFAQIFGFAVSSWFKSITGVPIPARLTYEAVLLATGLGILIPVASSIFPIRNALGKNLHDSLDAKHSKTSAVQISIERSEDNSFSSSVAIIGLLMASFGFGIYYIFPLSLLSFNLALMLNMFFMLLIAMLLGLVMLSLNVEHILERITVFIFLFWEKKAITSIVLKNLVAHKLRNRKTAIMYAISLGFIIFVNVSYSMQQSSMNYDIQQKYGAYLRINTQKSVGFSPRESRIIDQFLSSYKPQIVSYSYISINYPHLSSTWQSSQISNLGHIYSDNTFMYAASPNIFNTAISGFLKVSKVASDPNFVNTGDESVATQIYSQASAKKIIIGSVYSDIIGASLSQKIILQTKLQLGNEPANKTLYVVTPMAMMDSAPAFRFSKFPSVTGQDSIVSLPSYVSYANTALKSVRDVPLASFLLRLNTEDEKQIGKIKDYIKQNLNQQIGAEQYNIADYYKKIEPNKTASTIIQYFFSFTTVIAMVISFFSLMSSMFTNIYEQTKEIGILRAIGIPKSWMVRIYIFESFILVFTSSLLGVLIGSVVGWTMILQRVLFTQLPIPFVFPWMLLIIVFVCSIIFSFLSAFGPIKKVLNQPVINIMRILT